MRSNVWSAMGRYKGKHTAPDLAKSPAIRPDPVNGRSRRKLRRSSRSRTLDRLGADQNFTPCAGDEAASEGATAKGRRVDQPVP